MTEPETLIPKHGGYRNLKSFQVAQLVYDVTVRFCDRYIDPRSRTHDQMVQAARSGVQNIAEGSQASGTSKKMEMKLTNVARASLEELRLDYEDYLRQRGLEMWPPQRPAPLMRFKARRCATLDEVSAWVGEEVQSGTDKHGRTRTVRSRRIVRVGRCRSVWSTFHPDTGGQCRAFPAEPRLLSFGPPTRFPGRRLRKGRRLHRAAVPRPQRGKEGQTMTAFTESVVEEAALAWLDGLGYAVQFGPTIAPGEAAAEREDYGQVVLAGRLRDALARLNPHVPPAALDEAYRKLTRPDRPTLAANNHAAHRMIVEGVPVEYFRPDGSLGGDLVRVLDFDDPDNNDWLAVNQFTVVENRHERRADVVLFVNGLPLAVMELKNAADEKATIWAAFNQLQTYKQQIPALFTFNEALVISDGLHARIGTLTADRERFMPWRTIDGSGLADEHLSQLQVVIEGVFDRRRFLDLVRYFIVFEDAGNGVLIKKMAGYHQYHAVNAAVEETLRACAPAPDRLKLGEMRGVYRCAAPTMGCRASPATGASAWSGTRRAPARA